MSGVAGTASRLLAAGMLAALAPFAAAAPRVLLEAQDAMVQMEHELRCGHEAEVTVQGRDAALFAGDSTRLQSLLDATRALLGFECRNLPGMIVTGRLRGLDATGYQAVAGPASDWRLQPSSTLQVSSPSSGSQNQAGWRERADDRQGAMAFTVRELRRGMNVQASVDALRKGFGTEPRYDERQRLLSVVDGGCPISGELLRREFSLRPGQVCLEAKFNDDRPPRLDYLSFAQVVDDDQAADIQDALRRRYGQPAHSAQSAPASTRLGWGQQLDGAPGRYELEALIEVRRGTTVLVLRLQGGEHAPRFTVVF